MKLPDRVLRHLSDPAFERRTPHAIDEAASRLGVSVPSNLIAFYENYAGPFASTTTGFEVLDLVDGQPNVVSATLDCRRYHGLDERFLVVSDLVASSVVAVETTSGLVYVVDFEGGVESLQAGTMPPRWRSWEDFLEQLF